MMSNRLWTLQEAADWAGIAVQTLRKWKCTGKGNPKYEFPCTDEKPLRIVPNEFMSWYLNRKH